jgi:hypothetical protein
MAWQTPNVVENGASWNPLHQQKAEQYQHVVLPWRFCTAPMIDWTDQFFGVVFPQEFRR